MLLFLKRERSQWRGYGDIQWKHRGDGKNPPWHLRDFWTTREKVRIYWMIIDRPCFRSEMDIQLDCGCGFAVTDTADCKGMWECGWPAHGQPMSHKTVGRRGQQENANDILYFTTRQYEPPHSGCTAFEFTEIRQMNASRSAIGLKCLLMNLVRKEEKRATKKNLFIIQIKADKHKRNSINVFFIENRMTHSASHQPFCLKKPYLICVLFVALTALGFSESKNKNGWTK